MKKLFTTLLLLCCLMSAKAQYVTIPDSNFVKVLKAQFPTCMNGNQMDTTCSAIINHTQLGCYGSFINDLTGVQYFDKLTYLYAPENNLTGLPKLPPLITDLDVSGNNITHISSFPSTLKDLKVGENLLQSIPSLPPNLTLLGCNDNQMVYVPALPSKLIYLYCGGNKLTSLPALPASLLELHCSMNKLVTLPTLPATLYRLYCSYNENLILPALPATLYYLEVAGNKYTTLPALPASLDGLYMSYNEFTTMPALPANLRSLYCDYNKLTYVPTLPANIYQATLSHNNLSGSNAFAPLPASLRLLSCNNNLLSALPAMPAGLISLACSFNQLTALPVLPAGFQSLACSYNLLSSLPALPDSMYLLEVNNNTALACLPPLKKFKTGRSYFNISKTAITCLPNVIQHTGSIPQIDTLPLCAPCSAPVFHFGKITATTATILWTKLDCITNYRIAYRVKGTTAWTAIVSGPGAASRALNGLTAGTQYEIRMRTGCTSSTLSAWSAIQTFKTDVVCVPPSGITVTTIKKDRATLNWNAIAGVYSYKIRYRVQGTSVWSNQAAIAPVVHKTLTGLTANTTYEYQMLTVCDTTGAQASTWTATATFKTTLRMEEGSEAAAFVIYPNPVGNELRFSGIDSRMGDEMVVSDMLGRTLITQSANHTTINVSGLSRGVYFVTLRGGEGSVTRKFVKE